jgi:hypothetical protein
LTTSSTFSIYEAIVAFGNRPTARCVLKTMDLSLYPHEKVKYLPCQYNENAIFELLTVVEPKDGAIGRLDGMDRKYDGHAWTETQTTNLSTVRSELLFKYMKCLGHLRCLNSECPRLVRDKEHNEIYWDGSCTEILIPGPDPPIPSKCSMVC